MWSLLALHCSALCEKHGCSLERRVQGLAALPPCRQPPPLLASLRQHHEAGSPAWPGSRQVSCRCLVGQGKEQLRDRRSQRLPNL